MPQIQLRPAVLEDAERVYRWRNDPFILVRGSSQRPVLWDEHLEWFEETIHGSLRKMFIVLLDEEPIGQVRFNRLSDTECVISVYILEKFTGRGHGLETICRGCGEIFRLWNVEKIVACVRTGNNASYSAFLKAGFKDESSKRYCPPVHYTLALYRLDSGSSGKEGA